MSVYAENSRSTLKEVENIAVQLQKKQKVAHNPVLKFAKLTANARSPTRGSALAAGYDLYSAYDVIVPARGKQLIKTDIQINLPDGCYGRVAPRSGLTHKHFIDVGAGVIDQDYRGNVGVILFNFKDTDFEVKKGDRIAQLICERIFLPELQELETLENTERGDGGFGSTGHN
uniref:Deoxyuridine 5'-triphosphate nucleotidohydrolase n=1 Tax=Ciona savignyi TaxID=51511 RepID=H2ZPZ1_CIOSA